MFTLVHVPLKSSLILFLDGASGQWDKCLGADDLTEAVALDRWCGWHLWLVLTASGGLRPGCVALVEEGGYTFRN